MPRKSRPWFRFYVEAVHDRKLRRLKPEHRWLFVACLAAARQSCEPGWLLVGKDDPMGWDDLVDFAAMPLRSIEQGTDALMDAGVIGFDQERNAWFVPNWSERQYESDDVTSRTRKHRKERSNDVPGNVPETAEGTPPDTEADTDTETPPIPPVLERVVDGVFAKELALKQRTDTIRSVDGFRKWWETEGNGPGHRKRALWLIETYEMTVSQYVDACLSVTVPQWAASLVRKDSA